MNSYFSIRLLLLLIILYGFIFHFNVIESYFWTNIGFISLAKYLVNETDNVNDPSVAIDQLSHATLKHDKNIHAWRGLGVAFTNQKDNQQALSAWQNANISGDWLIQKGNQYRWLKQYDEAMNWYTLSTELEPAWGDGWYYIGDIYASQGDWEKALEFYQTAISKIEHYQHDVTISNIECNIGWLYHWIKVRHDSDKALEHYNIAISYDDFSTDGAKANCYFKRAELFLWRFEQPENAVQDYSMVLELEHDNVRVMATQQLAHYMASHDLKQTESDLLNILEIYPDNVWGYWRLGDIYRLSGQKDKAIIMYQSGLIIDPQNRQLQTWLKNLQP